VKLTSEVRFLLVCSLLLVALVVPVATAAIDAGTESPAPAAEAPSLAGWALMQSAPPPLIVIALGTLIVVVTVVRRARLTGLGTRDTRS
jgi:hypothetical protein